MSTLTSPASEDAFVAQQFDDIEQQREAAKLGMWIFLATEVLFFCGPFLGYTIFRFTLGQIFGLSRWKPCGRPRGTNTAAMDFNSTTSAVHRSTDTRE